MDELARSLGHYTIAIGACDPQAIARIKLVVSRSSRHSGEFSFLSAFSAPQVVTLATMSAPDCIILDSDLGVENALDILKALQDGAGKVSVPIIVLSTQVSARERADALKYGAFDHLVEPFSETKFIERLRSAIRQKLAGGRKIENPDLGQERLRFSPL